MTSARSRHLVEVDRAAEVAEYAVSAKLAFGLLTSAGELPSQLVDPDVQALDQLGRPAVRPFRGTACHDGRGDDRDDHDNGHSESDQQTHSRYFDATFCREAGGRLTVVASRTDVYGSKPGKRARKEWRNAERSPEVPLQERVCSFAPQPQLRYHGQRGWQGSTLPTSSASRQGSIFPHAHREPACPQAPQRAQGKDEDAGAPRSPAKAGGLHARLHDDPEEAELGAPEGRTRAVDEPDGGRRLYPGRGPQSAGAFGRADPRRPRQGPAGLPLQGHPGRARHLGRVRPQAGPLQVRREARLVVPRRAEVQARPVEADAVYESPLVTQVINKVMLDGKKSLAEQIVYGALAEIGEKTGTPPVEALEQAVKTVTPVLEVRSRRVGGANYQVPVEVPQRRARTLAVRWLVQYARDRREKGMQAKLVGEILDAINQQGGAFKKKDDIYRMAQANKAFAHYRW